MERKQFTFYRSFFEGVEKLRTKKEKAQAYEIICNYALNGVAPDLDGVSPYVATIFDFAKPVLDTALKRSERLTNRKNAEKLSDMVADIVHYKT